MLLEKSSFRQKLAQAKKEQRRINIWKMKQNIKNGIRTLGITLIGITIGASYSYSITGYIEFQRYWVSPENTYRVVLTRTTHAESTHMEQSVFTTAKADMEAVEDSKESSPVSTGTEVIIRDVFSNDPDVAVAVAMAESHMRTDATHTNTNGSVDCGLFQINSIHKPTAEQCSDARANVELARKIWNRAGWSAWSAYNNGSYKKFLIGE